MLARATVPSPLTGRSQANPASPLGSTVGSGVLEAEGSMEASDGDGLSLARADEAGLDIAVPPPHAAKTSVRVSQATPEILWCI
jgi:hypothetical protein